jgi:hypothetical protein
MQYAVLSDVHANLEALDAVLNDIATKGYGRSCSLEMRLVTAPIRKNVFISMMTGSRL